MRKILSIWVNYEKKWTFISDNELKKGTLETYKSQIPIIVLNQFPLSTVFAIVRSPSGPKFVLSGDPLYYVIFNFVAKNNKKKKSYQNEMKS